MGSQCSPKPREQLRLVLLQKPHVGHVGVGVIAERGDDLFQKSDARGLERLHLVWGDTCWWLGGLTWEWCLGVGSQVFGEVVRVMVGGVVCLGCVRHV